MTKSHIFAASAALLFSTGAALAGSAANKDQNDLKEKTARMLQTCRIVDGAGKAVDLQLGQVIKAGSRKITCKLKDGQPTVENRPAT